MFGLTFEKLLVIGVIAAFVIGPERLPRAAEQLAEAVRWLRDQAQGAKGRIREEMGDEFDDVDWRRLDPRQYDPRRIIRDALLDDGWGPDAAPAGATAASGATAATGAGAATAAAGAAAAGLSEPPASPAPEPSTSRPAWAVAGDPSGADNGETPTAAAPFDVDAT